MAALGGIFAGQVEHFAYQHGDAGDAHLVLDLGAVHIHRLDADVKSTTDSGTSVTSGKYLRTWKVLNKTARFSRKAELERLFTQVTSSAEKVKSRCNSALE